MSWAWPCKGPFCSKPGEKWLTFIRDVVLVPRYPLSFCKNSNKRKPLNANPRICVSNQCWFMILLVCQIFDFSACQTPTTLDRSYLLFLSCVWLARCCPKTTDFPIHSSDAPLLIHYCSNENAPWIYRWHSEIEHVLLPSPFFWRNFTFTCRKDFHPLLFSPSKSIWSYLSLPWAACPTASARPFCPPRSPGSSNALLHHLRCNMLEISTGNPQQRDPLSHKLPILQRDSYGSGMGKSMGIGVPPLLGVSRISLKNTCYVSPCDA